MWNKKSDGYRAYSPSLAQTQGWGIYAWSRPYLLRLCWGHKYLWWDERQRRTRAQLASSQHPGMSNWAVHPSNSHTMVLGGILSGHGNTWFELKTQYGKPLTETSTNAKLNNQNTIESGVTSLVEALESQASLESQALDISEQHSLLPESCKDKLQSFLVGLTRKKSTDQLPCTENANSNVIWFWDPPAKTPKEVQIPVQIWSNSQKGYEIKNRKAIGCSPATEDSRQYQQKS